MILVYVCIEVSSPLAWDTFQVRSGGTSTTGYSRNSVLATQVKNLLHRVMFLNNGEKKGLFLAGHNIFISKKISLFFTLVNI